MRRKNVKVSNFFKVMPTATSYNYLARWEKLKSFLAFKVSQCTKFLCEYHIFNCNTESCNQRSHLRDVSRWNHTPRSRITSMANRITKKR